MNYKPRIRKTCRRIFSRAFRFLDQPGEPGHKLQHFSFLLDRFNGCFYLHATIRLVRRWKHHQIWRLAKSLFERKVIVPNACSAEKPTLKKMKSFKLCPKLCFEYPLYVKLVIYIYIYVYPKTPLLSGKWRFSKSWGYPQFHVIFGSVNFSP